MQQYLDLLHAIKTKGTKKMDRTGTGTTSIFGWQSRYDLQAGFPLLTTKKLWLKGILHELLWILSGSTNIKYLQDNGVKIWDEWADENGDLGPVYGKQWRAWPCELQALPYHSVSDTYETVLAGQEDIAESYLRWNTIDQISNVIERIKAKPDDRRLIVTAWNPAEIDKMALPPCHCFFQFYTRELTIEQRKAAIGHEGAGLDSTWSDEQWHDWMDGNDAPRRYLDCQLYQRSADTFLGVPYNIASYAMLTMMVAQVCDMLPGEFIHTYGDAHIYSDHEKQTDLQLTREPRALPTLRINPDVKNIFDFKFEDFTLEGYDPHPHIAGAVSV